MLKIPTVKDKYRNGKQYEKLEYITHATNVCDHIEVNNAIPTFKESR